MPAVQVAGAEVNGEFVPCELFRPETVEVWAESIYEEERESMLADVIEADERARGEDLEAVR